MTDRFDGVAGRYAEHRRDIKALLGMVCDEMAVMDREALARPDHWAHAGTAWRYRAVLRDLLVSIRGGGDERVAVRSVEAEVAARRGATTIGM